MSSGNNVYWITGLSGAGKSTLCNLFVDHLRSREKCVIMLDGDELREALGATQAYSRADRLALALRYAALCRMLTRQNVDVAIATISLFKEVHQWNRANIPGYIEIFLDVPLEELKRRDQKGIYERAARGKIRNVCGVDLPVDFPFSPDITLRYHEHVTKHEVFEELINAVSKIGDLKN